MRTRKQKTNRQKWITYLDALWRFAVKVRDDGIDQYSLRAKGIRKHGRDAHHIFSRSNINTRWDLKNGIFVMGLHNYNVPHKHPELFRQFLTEKWMGHKEYEKLFLKAHSRCKFYTADFKMIAQDLMYSISQLLTLKPDSEWQAEYTGILRKGEKIES